MTESSSPETGTRPSALRWRRTDKVDGYESHDGVWIIEKQVALTFCENPHPQGKGNPYCEGGEEHEYVVWVLWRGDKRVDAGSTLRQMKAVAG